VRLRLLSLLLVLVLVLAGCGGGDDEESAVGTTEATATTSDAGECRTVEAPDPKPEGGETAPTSKLDPGKTYRLVVSTNCGAFTITLDQKLAPNTAASLVALAKSGFYDGTTFHRVVPGFVIQGGDPTGTGTGGAGYKTGDVPPPNARYVQGVVAMAKTGIEPPGTSGSQFFVVTGADVGLPAEYAIVGKVTDGIDTTLKIDGLGVGDGPPSIPVVIEKVTVEES
jgi:peptidyl-prolyl cis-trans isomerase B (cyclophilin B)